MSNYLVGAAVLSFILGVVFWIVSAINPRWVRLERRYDGFLYGIGGGLAGLMLFAFLGIAIEKNDNAQVRQHAEIASAKPAAPIMVDNRDYPTRYAAEMASHFLSGGPCGQFKSMISRIAEQSTPDNVKVLQIDKIVDAAYRSGCVVQ